MAHRTSIPIPEEEDPISAKTIRYQTLDRTGYENLLNKMEKLSELSEGQNDDAVLELRVVLHLVIEGVKTLQKDLSKPEAIKLAENVIGLLERLKPSAKGSTAESKQDIRKKIKSNLARLQVDFKFEELKKDIIMRLGK